VVTEPEGARPSAQAERSPARTSATACQSSRTRCTRSGDSAGLLRGEITTGCTGDGKRTRRKVTGTTKAAVVDKLRDLHHQLDKGITPKAGYTHYTVRQAAGDWLAHGLGGRSPTTIKKTRTSSSRSCEETLRRGWTGARQRRRSRLLMARR
jgi:hypothetical protein